MSLKFKRCFFVFLLAWVFIAGCGSSEQPQRRPRLCMIVGVDISGSFLGGRYYKDSMNFLGHYLDSHLRGLGGLEIPETLFVGSIGGSKVDEAKSFYPKQTFDGKGPHAIKQELFKIFPQSKTNPITDFNAFFKQAESIIRDRNLTLRPITLILLTDGKPALGKGGKEAAFRKIDFSGLEKLSRNITVRVLYTDAVTGKMWRETIPRKRIKIWTQDAVVMEQWKKENILIPGKDFESQDKLFEWIKDNVDFGVRSRRIK